MKDKTKEKIKKYASTAAGTVAGEAVGLAMGEILSVDNSDIDYISETNHATPQIDNEIPNDISEDLLADNMEQKELSQTNTSDTEAVVISVTNEETQYSVPTSNDEVEVIGCDSNAILAEESIEDSAEVDIDLPADDVAVVEINSEISQPAMAEQNPEQQDDPVLDLSSPLQDSVETVCPTDSNGVPDYVNNANVEDFTA